jgi:mono/diheme cytochrome c family protein
MTVPTGPNRRARHAALRVAQIATVSAAVIGVAITRQPQPLSARAADPTFAEDVAPILYRNCATCHRPGGIGPFSVLDYDSVKANVEDIRDAVSSGQMPPWHANGAHGVFRNDRRLSDADKSTILRWINAGAKPGNLKKLPPKPSFAATWSMGTPDLVVSMPEEYTVPASGMIEYQYFEVPTNLTEDKWVQAIEVVPGAREVVHHVLVYAKVPAPAPVPGAAPVAPAPRPAGTPAPRPVLVRSRLEQTPPRAPRADSAHGPPRQIGTLIGGIAPGTNVTEFPRGTAMRLRAGTVLVFQMHYTAHGQHAMKDRSSIGFTFAKEMPDEEILATQFTNGSFTIPAGAKDVAVPAEIGFNEPVKIYGMIPHTHLRGTRWKYELVKPDSTSETILDVPRYDFNWQTYYLFSTPLEIPAGGKIVSTAWYDNSSSNKHNPDHTKDVKWGDQTWEEMQYTGFLYSIPSRRLKK